MNETTVTLTSRQRAVLVALLKLDVAMTRAALPDLTLEGDVDLAHDTIAENEALIELFGASKGIPGRDIIAFNQQ